MPNYQIICVTDDPANEITKKTLSDNVLCKGTLAYQEIQPNVSDLSNDQIYEIMDVIFGITVGLIFLFLVKKSLF